VKDRSRFANNIRWQFVANGAQALLGGAYFVALGRSLGPANFGIFSVVSALVSVAGLLVELRIQDVVAREFWHVGTVSAARSDDSTRLIDLVLVEVLTRALSCLGLVLLSHAIVLSHLPESAGTLIAIAAAGFFISKSGWGASTGLLRVLGRTDLIAFCMSTDWGLRLLVTVSYWFLFGMDIQTALIIALISGGLCNVVQLTLAFREYSHRVAPILFHAWTRRGTFSRLRRNRRLIVANLGVSASDLMGKDLDVAIISSFLPPEKVGVYKMAKSFVQMLWRAVDPFYLAIMPEVQELWLRRDFALLRSVLGSLSVRLLVFSIALVGIACASVAAFGDMILGPGYAGLASLMGLMSIWIVVCAPLIWGHPLAVAINHPELAVGGSLIGSAAGLTAFLTLTPRLGLTGAAIAWVITLVVGFGFTSGLATVVAVRKGALQV
jgi:O-antigen/teichoic acid export membrane protein